MKKITKLKGFSIKFGIVCSIVVAGCGAINAVIDTGSKIVKTYLDAKKLVVEDYQNASEVIIGPLEDDQSICFEEEIKESDYNPYGIYWWLMSILGIFMYLLLGKANKKHKKYLEENTKIEK